MEVGSEFWQINKEDLNGNNQNFFNFGIETKYTLSGRTSIDFVLDEILLTENIKTVYFPSYSCNSMIKPFLEHGLQIKYYDVFFDDGLKYNINVKEDCDIFFAMNYFGYTSTNMDEYIQCFQNRGIIVIEDITHSIFSEKKFSSCSNYLIASLRKWLPILSGGIAINLKTKFNNNLSKVAPQSMITLKHDAMNLKKRYIEYNDKEIKNSYLKKYEEFNIMLENNYKNYMIDEESYEILMKLDFDQIKQIRKENARTIYNKLSNKKKIKFLVKDLREEDCLLFVPIIVDKEIKEKLKSFLISNQIYCPTHWQIDNNINDLYQNEISLVCDQRYNKEQIEKYVDLIIKFFEE